MMAAKPCCRSLLCLRTDTVASATNPSLRLLTDEPRRRQHSTKFWPLRSLLLGCCLFVFHAEFALAQLASVENIVKQKAQWKRFADAGRQLHFDARFQGRAAESFRVDKMDVDFRLPSSIRLPDRMRDAQRLEITGKFVADSGRLHFFVTALVIRDTDLDQLAKSVAAVPEDQPDALLAIANKYEPLAQFYQDEALASEVTRVRTQFAVRKRKLAGGNAQQLQAVFDSGAALNVDPRLLNSIRFEILLAKWQQPGSSQPKQLAELLSDAKTLPGWDDKQLEIPERLRLAFPKAAVAEYDNGTDADRKVFHRLLYADIRRQQIRSQLVSNGSNGLMLAQQVREEFPDATKDAAALEEREVNYRMDRIAELDRQELQQLVDLLSNVSRKEQVPAVVQDWLKAQEKRFGTIELAGLLRTADEHFFAAEQWKQNKHQERGIELLKQAWAIAAIESPDDATLIADRLRRVGWEHLNGQWLTSKQVQMLPKDDIQLAIREGRVVRGMTTQQVTSTLGKPARVSRLGSSRAIRELWIYDGTGSAGVVVRFRRSSGVRTDENLVEEVSRISASFGP